MGDAFFERLDAHRYRASGHTQGPWSAGLMHAGPPTALLAHAIHRHAGLPGARLGRICVEILSPVPLGDVEVTVRTVRPGSRVALFEARLAAREHAVMLARCWYVRSQDFGERLPQTDYQEAPPDGVPLSAPASWLGGYLQAIEWRLVTGGFEQAGPATVWARPRVALIAGQEATPEERLLMIADSASGISAVASPRDLLFVNTDLTVHLRRRPRSDWLWLSARTRIDPNGSGVAAGVIGDQAGDLGTTGQLLFIEPIHRRADGSA